MASEPRVERNVEMRMRDGVVLRADIYRPPGDERRPILLMRTPYEKSYALAYSYAHPAWYARHGYVVVVQDPRGRYRSEGAWEPFRHEVEDGEDTLGWLATLEGTTGKVGMYGASYPGAVQLQAAFSGAPALGCICPAITSSGPYADWTYEGGALHLAFTTWWALSLSPDVARRRGDVEAEIEMREATGSPARWYRWRPLATMPPLRESGLAPYYFDWLRHPGFDDYWRPLAFAPSYSKVTVPGLHIGGWYDIFLAGTLRNFRGLQAGGGAGARGRQRLLVGPWVHYPWSRQTGELDFGPAASSRIIDETQVRFFDQVLKGVDDGIGSEPPVKLFVMGENVWRDEDAWPLKRAVSTDWYLHSDGWAAGSSGDGRLEPVPPQEDEAPDTYVYNPADPSLSRGGHSCCEEAVTPMGPFDQRPVERRMDVLCYTSAALTEPLEVTGPVTVTLFAATDGVDTDFVARLVDVFPDGRAINLTEGIVRASYRHGGPDRHLLEPGAITEYRIDLRATSNLFGAGHAIRVDIASASFPMWDPNPNSATTPAEAGPSDLRTATQTIFHDRPRPSRISLPVVPR